MSSRSTATSAPTAARWGIGRRTVWGPKDGGKGGKKGSGKGGKKGFGKGSKDYGKSGNGKGGGKCLDVTCRCCFRYGHKETECRKKASDSGKGGGKNFAGVDGPVA